MGFLRNHRGQHDVSSIWPVGASLWLSEGLLGKVCTRALHPLKWQKSWLKMTKKGVPSNPIEMTRHGQDSTRWLLALVREGDFWGTAVRARHSAGSIEILAKMTKRGFLRIRLK